MDNHALITLRDITFSYQSKRPVLEGLNLQLNCGDRIGLVGGNGQGKSTLLHLIVGLLKPGQGEVEIFGVQRQTEKDFHEIRGRIGLLFQDPEDQLFCPTVAEDVAFGPLNLGKTHDEAMAIVAETLSELGLTGYEHRVTYRLSFGEKRLVSIAAVLAMQPEVLLLDEPTASLDKEWTQRVIEALNQLNTPMLVVSHNEDFLRAVTAKQVFLKGGRISD